MKYLDYSSLLSGEPAYLALFSTFQFDPDFFERRLLKCGVLQKARRIAKMETAGGRPLIEDPDFARKLADLEIQIEALDATERRIFDKLSSGQSVGAMSSLMKTRGSEIGQKVTEIVLEAAGVYGNPFVQDTYAHLEGRSNEPLPAPEHLITSAGSYFNNRKTSIYAGSNEIQRNIMAKAILGL